MNIYLFDEEQIITFTLPIKIIGNFWMTDSDNNNIVNICDKDGKWVISGSENTIIDSGNIENDEMYLIPKKYYVIERNNKKHALYADTLDDETYSAYVVDNERTIKIGKSITNEISVNIPYFLDLHISITYKDNKWIITKAEGAQVYLNDQIIKKPEVVAKNGDVINIYGLRVVLSKGLIFVNNLLNLTTINSLSKKSIVATDKITDEEIKNENMYKDSDYFLKSPRLRKSKQTLQMNIDSPPNKENMQETPLIMMIAPMLAMAATSTLTLTNTLQAVADGEKTWKQSLPSLIVTGAMLFVMLVWPIITRWYEKHRKKKREKDRQEKYSAYLMGKQKEIIEEFENQRKIIEESILNTNICYDYIINKRRTLWERKKDQGDFLTVRIGRGQVPFDANISYHLEDFSMEDDNLKEKLDKLIEKYKYINDVPLAYSFAENKLTAISGIYPKYVDFTNNILLQMMAYHGYDELKIVIFSSKKNYKRWEYMKISPYVFSKDRSLRFFATTTEEIQQVSEYLENIFNNRKVLATSGGANEKIGSYTKFNNYFLIVIDDIDLSRKMGIVTSVLEEKQNLGFSLVILEEKLSKIPSEVNKFITIGESASALIDNLTSNPIKFTDEIVSDYDMFEVTKTLANLPLYIDNDVKQLPSVISFLELFSIGQVEQLNVLNKWKENDSTKSLKTPVGVNENNDPFILDIHEKAHGPHGLIAGMTGSGKSEFIITYLLSLAVNYSPEDVSFVLIDYKGGGLANAFIDSETGEKLPHVVGTITNLDKAEINRALSSIQSELRRRQTKFNEARDQVGESTIDIYKYQRLYKDGVIKEPIPHLIIISDEFAELKDQQPDFMDDLVSAARIGRSLGVHLILATQKPSGVVNAQIWSNAKFKVCLKVQDKADSMEMIKTDAAAELKNVGRFYLQVGYNEYFAMGQSAWAGAQYYPNKEYKKATDKNLYFIDNTGNISKTINNSIAKKNIKSQGEELTAIVKYLINISKTIDFKINKLWLDKIPNIILLEQIKNKYKYTKENYIINPIIGEFDDPDNQIQGMLTLPITENGNTVIYGNIDSGKDEFLTSLIYSIVTTYSSSEVNLYLIDFGAETLNNYNDIPQVGDVLLSSDEEKLENLVKMLTTELNKRKKAFTSYNGNYQDYIKLSGKKIPNIIVVINSIESLNDMYQDYCDKISPIIRECSKYGISFVITTTSQTTIKYKIAQSCKQQICLQMNNESDYRDILGKTNGLVPSSNVGRGLIKLEKVVEFQTVSLSTDNNSYEVIKSLKSNIPENALRAKKIPVMPDVVKLNVFEQKFNDIKTVPIGITRDALTVYLHDFSKNTLNIISANEIDSTKIFMTNFLKLLERNNSFDKMVIDGCNYFTNFSLNLVFNHNIFNSVVDKIKEYDDEVVKKLSENNSDVRSLAVIKNKMIVILGFSKFFEALDNDHKEMFKKILDNEKEALKINFVLIDTPPSFKKYEYDEWFKNSVNTNNGVWIGSGVTQQYLLKTLIQPSNIANITNEFGVCIKNGMPTVVKLVNEIKNM